MTTLQKTSIEKQIQSIKSEQVRLRVRFIYNVFNDRFVFGRTKRRYMSLLQNRIVSVKRMSDKEALPKLAMWFRIIEHDVLKDSKLINEYKQL
jgi:hypothetical protein